MTETKKPEATESSQVSVTVLLAVLTALQKYADASNWDQEDRRWLGGGRGSKLAAAALQTDEVRLLRQMIAEKNAQVVHVVDNELREIQRVVDRVIRRRGLVKSITIDVDQGEATVQLRTEEMLRRDG